MTREIEIQKVKLKTKDDTADVSYDEILTDVEGDVIINNITMSGGHKCHLDMKRAIEMLAIHLALITEQVEMPKGKKFAVNETGEIVPHLLPRDQSILTTISATGISMGGDDDSRGVTIIGSRKMMNGSILNLTSPFLRLDDKDYKFIETLKEDLAQIDIEANAYLQGKCAPPAQMEMIFENSDVPVTPYKPE